jgi:hypothetical protein
MTPIGNTIVTCNDGEQIQLRPLTVRQLATMMRVMGERKAREAIDDGKHAGLSSDEIMVLAADARRNSALTSWLIRWCFELEGALQIVREACAGDAAKGDKIAESMSPDDLTNLALALIGFEWDASQSKWVSRSARRSGPETGSTSVS